MKDLKIIGLTGTLGSGKGTVANYLKKKGFVYASCSDYLRKILAKQGMEETIANLKELGDSLREKHGFGHITEQLLKEEIKGLTVVDSLRHPGEIEVLKQVPQFILIAVDAPLKARYERITQRKRSSDNISFEEFSRQEKLQLEGGVGGQIQLKESIEMADYLIVNEGSVEDLKYKVDNIVKQIAF